MKFAINFSRPAASLLRAGRIQLDYFKCPAWPDIVDEARRDAPVFVHFPLRVGAGTGEAINEEMEGRPDWDLIEAMLAAGTPLLNVHLMATPAELPDIPPDSPGLPLGKGAADRAVEAALRDLIPLTRRFGADRVVVENIYGEAVRPLVEPAVIRRIVEEAGCGFLFDISHARLAARRLGIDPRAYIADLPLDRIREIHVTGIQRLDETWMERVRRSGTPTDHPRNIFGRYYGQLFDHLPMTDADWEFFDWSLAQVASGAWAAPWVVTLEYGGNSALWEALTDEGVLAEQAPRMYQTVISIQTPHI